MFVRQIQMMTCISVRVDIFVVGEKFVYRTDEGAVVEFDCFDNGTSVVMDNSTFVSCHFFLVFFLF